LTPTVRITKGFFDASMRSGRTTGASIATSSPRKALEQRLASANSRDFIRLRIDSTSWVVAVTPTSAVSSAVSISSRRGMSQNARMVASRQLPAPEVGVAA
jgi:hypothetical protein